jgi:hypothetical protein
MVNFTAYQIYPQNPSITPFRGCVDRKVDGAEWLRDGLVAGLRAGLLGVVAGWIFGWIGGRE